MIPSGSDVQFINAIGPIGLVLLLGWLIYLRWGGSAKFEPDDRNDLKAIRAAVQRVEKALLVMNARVGNLEEYRGSHDKQDDERYGRQQEDSADIHGELSRHRDEITDVRGKVTPLVGSVDLLMREARGRKGRGEE